MAEKEAATKRLKTVFLRSIPFALVLLVCLGPFYGVKVAYDIYINRWIDCDPLAIRRMDEVPEVNTSIPSIEQLTLRTTFGVPIADEPVESMALSPSGELLSIKREHEVQVWEMVTGTQLHSYSVPGQFSTNFAWSPDSAQIAAGWSTFVLYESADQEPPSTPEWTNHVVVWDVGTEQQIFSLEGSPGNLRKFVTTHDVKYSPDGKLLTAAAGRGMYVWDAQTGEELCHITARWKVDEDESAFSLVIGWREDGVPLIATYELGYGFPPNSVSLWDVEKRKKVLKLEREPDIFLGATWSPDGTHIALHSLGEQLQLKELTIWDATTGELQFWLDDTWLSAWSPDGRMIVTSSPNGLLAIWDIETREHIATLDDEIGEIRAVDWSRDGRTIVAMDENGLVGVWEVVPTK